MIFFFDDFFLGDRQVFLWARQRWMDGIRRSIVQDAQPLAKMAVKSAVRPRKHPLIAWPWITKGGGKSGGVDWNFPSNSTFVSVPLEKVRLNSTYFISRCHSSPPPTTNCLHLRPGARCLVLQSSATIIAITAVATAPASTNAPPSPLLHSSFQRSCFRSNLFHFVPSAVTREYVRPPPVRMSAASLLNAYCFVGQRLCVRRRRYLSHLADHSGSACPPSPLSSSASPSPSSSPSSLSSSSFLLASSFSSSSSTVSALLNSDLFLFILLLSYHLFYHFVVFSCSLALGDSDSVLDRA